MIYILAFMNVVLLIIILYQYKKKLKRDEVIDYSRKKLSEIMSHKSKEKLLVFTDDKNLQLVLVEINRLLKEYQKIDALHLEAQNSMKKMISNISHDLKTPLTVIMGYIETMIIYQDKYSDETKDYLNKIHNKTQELVSFINQFFDMSKIESGDFDFPIKKIEINEVCRESILAFYDILNNSDIKVHIGIPNEPIYMMGNKNIIERILNNLLSNAIKYGLDGKMLGLDVIYDKNYVNIEVWDNGKGIDEVNIDHVFERLYTLEDSRNKSYQGSGLGLTITKKLVEKLGGNISLKSIPYKKTVFKIKFKRINY